MEFIKPSLPEKQPDQVFVIRVKICTQIYYLASLIGLALSASVHDAVVILDAKTAHNFERITETRLEQELDFPVTCMAMAVCKKILTE